MDVEMRTPSEEAPPAGLRTSVRDVAGDAEANASSNAAHPATRINELMLALGADADARSAAGLRAHRLTDRGFYCTRLAILATASPLPASASTGFEPQQGCEV